MDHAYISAVLVLKQACSREVDRAQVGEPPSRELLKAIDAVVGMRIVSQMLEEVQP